MNNIEAFRNPGKNINLLPLVFQPSRKNVFGSHAQTAHVWNSNNVESGRSSDERMYFQNGIIYSYGSHFAIGMNLKTSEGDITLLNSSGYSPSTGKHKNHVWHATSHKTYQLPDLTKVTEGLRCIANNDSASWRVKYVVEYIKEHILDAPPESLILLARIARVQRKLCAYYRTALAARNKAKAIAEKRMLETQIREAKNAAAITDNDFIEWIEKNLGAWAKGHRESTADTFKRLAREYWRFERTAKKHLGVRALATIKSRHQSLRKDANHWHVKLEKRAKLAEFGRYKGTFQTILSTIIHDGGFAVAEYQNAETIARLANYFIATRVNHETRQRLVTLSTAASARVNEIKREREAERFADQAAKRAAWLAGGSIGYERFSDENGRALLRVKGDELQTSHGASVPLAHAIKAFPLIKLCRENARPWHRNGHTVRVGHYQIDAIDIEGNFKAGCHSIGWNEVERIALALGVFTSPAADTSEETAH